MAKFAPKVRLSNGNEMPILGLGTWKSKPGEVYEAVKIAIEAGYRHLDCAYAYDNEHEVGRAISEVLQSGLVKREELFVTTKCWNTHHSRNKVPECLQQSLNDLKLDYVDLYLIHWPMGFQEGGEKFPKDANGEFLVSDVDYLDTWKGMEDQVRNGKVKSIGLSNFNSEQIDRVIQNAEIKPVVLQVSAKIGFMGKSFFQ